MPTSTRPTPGWYRVPGTPPGFFRVWFDRRQLMAQVHVAIGGPSIGNPFPLTWGQVGRLRGPLEDFAPRAAAGEPNP